jgi:hypothetical protein
MGGCKEAAMGMDIVPIWALFVGTILVVIIAIEAGYRLGDISHRRSADEKESPVSAFAGAVLGLLAFMLAFTFSIASNRYDARKDLVRDEANAVRTAYLRSDFLPEPDRTEAKGLFKEYLDARVAFAQAANFGPERLKAMFTHADRVQGRLWDMAVANARKDMNSDVAALYLESLNEVIGVHALRVAVGVNTRIPIGIWGVLYGLTILGMMGVGYHTGIAGSKRSMATLILAVSFAMVIAVIAALDRPEGFIRVTQQPLLDLQNFIAADS